MRLKFKNTFIGYFQFYYSVIGNKFLINLVLSIGISFLDGLGLAMFIPLLQAVGDDGVVHNQPSDGNISYFTDAIQNLGFDLTFTTILVFLILLFALKGLMRFFQLSYQVNLRHLFMRKVRFYLVDSLRDLSYVGFLKLDAGKIQNTLTTEVQRLFQGMTYYLNAAQSMAMLLTYVTLAFFANYQFAFLVAVGAGMSNFVYRRIYVSTKRASLDLSKKGNDFNSFLIQSILYFKYLKSTNYFGGFSKRLKDVIMQSEGLYRKMGFYGAITSAVREPLIIIIVVLVIFVQIKWMGSSLGSIILSLLLFYRSLNFLMIIQSNWQSFIQSIGGMEAVTSMGNEMAKFQESQNSAKFESMSTGISIIEGSFSYGDHKVLDRINISIPKKTTVAFVGESGSGKTTLANMVIGLIHPDSGTVLLDGKSLREYNVDSYREKIGYISQEPVIFNDDIYNNITFWAERTEENIKRFWKIVNLASLDQFIQQQPQQEYSNLGDNGILISGGQKQRISIARELYKDVEILVLDEATSALDSETEKVIQENIEKLHGLYTMVIIAHRLSTIKNVDNIYLIERGKVVGSGDFKEMLQSSERFKRMVSLQGMTNTTN